MRESERIARCRSNHREVVCRTHFPIYRASVNHAWSVSGICMYCGVTRAEAKAERLALREGASKNEHR